VFLFLYMRTQAISPTLYWPIHTQLSTLELGISSIPSNFLILPELEPLAGVGAASPGRRLAIIDRTS